MPIKWDWGGYIYFSLQRKCKASNIGWFWTRTTEKRRWDEFLLFCQEHVIVHKAFKEIGQLLGDDMQGNLPFCNKLEKYNISMYLRRGFCVSCFMQNPVETDKWLWEQQPGFYPHQSCTEDISSFHVTCPIWQSGMSILSLYFDNLNECNWLFQIRCLFSSRGYQQS